MRSFAAIALVWIAAPAAAQVALDDSFGPAGPIALVDGEYAIDDDLGEYAGENLFHSFSTFDVNLGETATFSASKGLPARVIARVTAGDGTRIAGTLRSTIPGADLFLLDPKGVEIFGEGARLEVDGSFYASTADELRFEEEDEVLRVADVTPLLSSAAPAAFGFTSENPSPILIGSLQGFDNQFSVPAGETLSFVGGNVVVFGDPSFGYAPIVVNAPGAHLEIAAAAGPGEIPVRLQEFDFADDDSPALGEVGVASAAILMSSSGTTPAGSVMIRAGRFALESGAQIVAEHQVDGVDAAGPIDIAVAGELFLGTPEPDLDPSLIRTSSAGDGRGGDVILSGDEVTFADGATVELLQGSLEGGTSTHAGDGPDLHVSGRVVKLETGALLTSTGSSSASESISSSIELVATQEVSLSGGAAIQARLRQGHSARQGTISIDSPLLSVARGTGDQATGIFSWNQGAGDGTRIFLDTDALSVQGSIVSGNQIPADPGGPIEIDSDHVLVSNTFGDDSDGLIMAQNGGSITVNADRVLLLDGGQIVTRTFTDAPAGDLRIEDADTVLASGVDMQNRPAGLFTRTRSTGGPDGTGGLLSIDTRILELLDGAELSSATFGSADAGRIEIDASERVTVGGGPDGASLISASTLPSTTPLLSVGNGGTISIDTDWLELRDGGQVTTSTNTVGNGGLIDVHARVVEVSGIDPLGSDPSGFFSQSNPAAGGAGGNVSITATERFLLSNGGLVSARSSGTGLAGDVVIDAGQLFQMENATVSTEALLSTGGNVKVTAGSLVYLLDSNIRTDVQGGTGRGGDVTIDPVHTVLNHSSITANAIGDGGNLLIQTDHYFQSGDSFLSASSELGIDGTIQVTAPDTDLTGGLARLPATYLDASALLERDCAARTERAGSFAVRVQTLPPAPDESLTPIDAGYCPLSEEKNP